MSTEGGMLQSMHLPFKLGLGGVLGDGDQMMSWISLTDILRAFEYVINNPKIEGPVNFVAPEPASNYVLTKTLGKILHRPTLFWVPKFLLNSSSVVLGDFVQETLLSNVNVKPAKLLENGFQFEFPTLQPALENLFLQKTQ